MPSTFRPLKRNCPICSGARRDCRENTQNHLIHCRHDVGEVPGYKYVGEDKHGFFMWAVDDGSDRSLEELELKRREREALKQRRLQQEQDRLSQLLSPSERDIQIRKLLAQLGLKAAHRADLHQRGLTDSQIEAGLFRSVEPWQKLDREISHRLAGINIIGSGLTTPHSGYLCPIWNPEGQIIGWQLRLDKTEDGGKYRWSTSASKKRPNGPTAHLPNGELPLTCCHPLEGKPQILAIGLIEGVGPKPFITAIVRSQIIIGAAGGNFAASPETLKAYLDTLSAELGTQQLTLYPDAGAISNSHVMRQYRRLKDLVARWGYTLRVAWWNQIDKDTDLDADELLAAGRGEEIEEITWAEFEAHAHNPHRIYQEIVNLFQKTKSFIQHSVVGFGKVPQRQEVQPLQKPTSVNGHEPAQPKTPFPSSGTLSYVPGQLPTPQEYQDMGCPRIIFQDGQRLQVWQEAVTKGWKHILDKSAPGLGKSHAAGIALPDAFAVEKLWYFALDHRNPTTGVIEQNYTDLPVRNAGMKIDPSRKTPLGNNVVIWPKPGEEPDIPGNCHRAPLFALMRDNNIKGVESSQESPICTGCKLNHLCKGASGAGYGFRSQRKHALKSSRNRAHPDSAPTPIEFPYEKNGAFWDEAGTLIQPMESVTATLADFERVMGELASIAPELHSLLKPLALELKPLFNQQLKPPSRYGFDDAAIRALLPEKPENLTQIIQQLETILQPDFDFIQQPDSIDFDKSISHPMRRLVREHFAKNAYREAATGLENVLLNWFVPFLKVWNGFPGALRCEKGRLTIFSRSTRHTHVIKSLKFNIYLDATISAERLGLLVGIAPEEILAIEQWHCDRNNLRIVQITGMGKLGKERSNGLQIRVQALRTELLRRHPDIAFGDWKAQAEEGDGQWFVNLRGSNEFQNRSALAVFGIPYQNIGYLQALYQTLTGCYASLNEELLLEGLQRFIDAHVEADIEQAMERLRSLIRPDEQLTFYFVGDYDLSFLGMPVEQIEAFLIAPEAGTAAQITRWKIQEAFGQLTLSGEKITQQKLALEANVTQGRLSQIAAEFGGWGVLKKILAALLDGFNSTTNNFSGLSEEERWLAQTYLPLVVNEMHIEALSEIGIAVKAYGVKGFLRILQSCSLPTQVRLLSRIFEEMPEGVQQELREVAMGSA
ncbi:MAG: hypothetical protein AB1589_00050 [Cyanobacteriota bacterium]